MCTVTWRRDGEGYDLLFNRDELRSRGAELPPRVWGAAEERGTLRFAAPVDPDFGGSWVAVNDRGLTVGVLNGFRTADRDLGETRSRGLLVTDLATSPDLEVVRRRLAGLDPGLYRSFRLLAVAPGRGAIVAEWDRVGLGIDENAEDRIPIVSSGFDESEVGRMRREEYARVAAGEDPPSRELLLRYHRSHTNGPSAFSVCMHREEAATRSLTVIGVTAESVRLAHFSGPPCETRESRDVELERVAGDAPRARR